MFHLERKAGDGHDWHFEKSIAMTVRIASRGEAYCGVYMSAKRQCREPAAIISEIGDAYCARCYGWNATQRMRELDSEQRKARA